MRQTCTADSVAQHRPNRSEIAPQLARRVREPRGRHRAEPESMRDRLRELQIEHPDIRDPDYPAPPELNRHTYHRHGETPWSEPGQIKFHHLSDCSASA